MVNYELSLTIQSDTKQLGSNNYLTTREFKKVGGNSKKNLTLQDLVRKVQNFIVFARRTKPSAVFNINIEQYNMRKNLSEQLEMIYEDKISIKFDKKSSNFTVNLQESLVDKFEKLTLQENSSLHG